MRTFSTNNFVWTDLFSVFLCNFNIFSMFICIVVAFFVWLWLRNTEIWWKQNTTMNNLNTERGNKDTRPSFFILPKKKRNAPFQNESYRMVTSKCMRYVDLWVKLYYIFPWYAHSRPTFWASQLMKLVLSCRNTCIRFLFDIYHLCFRLFQVNKWKRWAEKVTN